VRAQRALEKVVSIEDRLQGAPGCLIADDKQVVSLSIRWVKSKTRSIVIKIEEINASRGARQA
jgi:Holliday junction resolvase RusA-like endonuclease